MKKPFLGTAGKEAGASRPLPLPLDYQSPAMLSSGFWGNFLPQEKILQFPPQISCRQEFHFWNKALTARGGNGLFRHAEESLV